MLLSTSFRWKSPVIKGPSTPQTRNPAGYSAGPNSDSDCRIWVVGNESVSVVFPVLCMVLDTHKFPAGLDLSDVLVSMGGIYCLNQGEIREASQTPNKMIILGSIAV